MDNNDDNIILDHLTESINTLLMQGKTNHIDEKKIHKFCASIYRLLRKRYSIDLTKLSEYDYAERHPELIINSNVRGPDFFNEQHESIELKSCHIEDIKSAANITMCLLISEKSTKTRLDQWKDEFKNKYSGGLRANITTEKNEHNKEYHIPYKILCKYVEKLHDAAKNNQIAHGKRIKFTDVTKINFRCKQCPTCFEFHRLLNLVKLGNESDEKKIEEVILKTIQGTIPTNCKGSELPYIFKQEKKIVNRKRNPKKK